MFKDAPTFKLFFKAGENLDETRPGPDIKLVSPPPSSVPGPQNKIFFPPYQIKLLECMGLIFLKADAYMHVLLYEAVIFMPAYVVAR